EKETERVLPEGVAKTTNDILSTVVTSGTAGRARLDEFAAGKTGTTENYGDAWFVGATEDMTVAVWVGYPGSMRPMQTEFQGGPVAGGTYPAMIWQDFMMGFLEVRKQRLTDACERARARALKELEAGELLEEPQVCIDAGLAPDPNAPPPPLVDTAPVPQEVVPQAPVQEAPPVEEPVDPVPEAPVEQAPVEPAPAEPAPAPGGGASAGATG
ncbi:MAG TPA: penicillin-binding transpeptidase domain-containing protein, partial [Solirubrobacteraceae bacterium]|nr:penicillin-binding transpeptidase domain-containing protein [Solirubrobacteraceae bacterium]